MVTVTLEPPPAPPTALPLDVDALRRGDADECARLVEKHGRMVAGVCRTIGLRGADADDATAEAFAAVFVALPKFEGRSQLSTWVYRIAFRQVLRVAQYRKRQPTSADVETAVSLPPGATLEAAEQRDRLWAVVATLEPRQAMAVDLYYRRGLDVATIAETLECPANTVKTLLGRARQRLKIVLTDLGETP